MHTIWYGPRIYGHKPTKFGWRKSNNQLILFKRKNLIDHAKSILSSHWFSSGTPDQVVFS